MTEWKEGQEASQTIDRMVYFISKYVFKTDHAWTATVISQTKHQTAKCIGITSSTFLGVTATHIFLVLSLSLAEADSD